MVGLENNIVVAGLFLWEHTIVVAMGSTLISTCQALIGLQS